MELSFVDIEPCQENHMEMNQELQRDDEPVFGGQTIRTVQNSRADIKEEPKSTGEFGVNFADEYLTCEFNRKTRLLHLKLHTDKLPFLQSETNTGDVQRCSGTSSNSLQHDELDDIDIRNVNEEFDCAHKITAQPRTALDQSCNTRRELCPGPNTKCVELLGSADQSHEYIASPDQSTGKPLVFSDSEHGQDNGMEIKCGLTNGDGSVIGGSDNDCVRTEDVRVEQEPEDNGKFDLYNGGEQKCIASRELHVDCNHPALSRRRSGRSKYTCYSLSVSCL